MNDSPNADRGSPEKREIYRKEAVEEEFSFRRLNQVLVVISSKEWILIAAIVFVLVLFFLWCLFGSIPIKVSGKGMILDLDQINTIQSQIDGTVTHLHINEEDHVAPGQLLLELQDPIVSFEYEFYGIQAGIIQNEYKTLAEQVDREQLLRISHLSQQLQHLRLAETNKLKEIDLLKDSLTIEEGLLEKNVLTQPTVNQSRLNLLISQTGLTEILTNIKLVQFELSKEYRQDELWAKEASVREANRLKEEASVTFGQTQIAASDSAIVVGRFVSEGIQVTKGMPLVTLQKTTDPTPPRFFYAYISSDVAKAIRPGMNARVELSKYLLKQYGYIIGTVKEVSVLPVSDATILTKLFNPSLVEALKHASVDQVIVELEKDPDAPSGYCWSSGKGPEHPLTIGNVGEVYLVVDRIAPIYYLIPRLASKGDASD